MDPRCNGVSLGQKISTISCSSSICVGVLSTGKLVSWGQNGTAGGVYPDSQGVLGSLCRGDIYCTNIQVCDQQCALGTTDQWNTYDCNGELLKLDPTGF